MSPFLYPLAIKCLAGDKNLAKSAVGPVLTTLEIVQHAFREKSILLFMLSVAVEAKYQEDTCHRRQRHNRTHRLSRLPACKGK